MRLYHATTPESAAAILAGGFRNSAAVSSAGVPAGVWLTDVPTRYAATLGECRFPVLLVVELPEVAIEGCVVDGSPGEIQGRWREFCIPAEVVNTGTVSPVEG